MPGRILGVHEIAKPATTTGRYPAARWGREFVAKNGGGPLPEATTEAALVKMVLAKVLPHTLAGGGCVVSIKADMVSVGKGRWGSRFAAVGRALAGLDAIVLLWHEWEDNWTARIAVPAHNRGRDALKSEAPDLEVGACSMAYQWRPGSKTTADATAWTADLQADIYLADVYSGNSFPPVAILPEHPGWVRWYTEMIAAWPGRRWGIAERGILAGPTRAATIAREAEWLATDPIGRTCELYLWWNTGGTEDNPGWVLDDAGQRAVAQLLDRIAIPAGYRPGPFDGVLVSERSGVLVAADLTAAHDRFLQTRQA
jgi:hypothetical protein